MKNNIKASTTFIKVKTSFEGYHHYPDANNNHNYKPIQFLTSIHRHIFHVIISIEVFHNDRDIEFIKFKHELETPIHILKQNMAYNKDSTNSCEDIADELFSSINNKYPNRKIIIEVLEDNESGAIKTYEA